MESELGISSKTIEKHRQHLTENLHINDIARLHPLRHCQKNHQRHRSVNGYSDFVSQLSRKIKISPAYLHGIIH